MTNLLLHNYYYRYRQKRQLVKTLVDSENYQAAKTQLENDIAEHESKYSTELLEQRRDFNFGEKLTLIHALNHLVEVTDNNNPIFLDNQGNTKHHDDIVKDALLFQPKSDYSDPEF